MRASKNGIKIVSPKKAFGNYAHCAHIRALFYRCETEPVSAPRNLDSPILTQHQTARVYYRPTKWNKESIEFPKRLCKKWPLCERESFD